MSRLLNKIMAEFDKVKSTETLDAHHPMVQMAARIDELTKQLDAANMLINKHFEDMPVYIVMRNSQTDGSNPLGVVTDKAKAQEWCKTLRETDFWEPRSFFHEEVRLNATPVHDYW